MIISNAVESLQQLSTCVTAMVAAPGPFGDANAAAVALVADMTKITCDAYVVPHWREPRGSFFQGADGLAAAIIVQGGMTGLLTFEYQMRKLGRLPDFGEVFVTEGGEGRSRYLLNTIALGTPSGNPAEAQRVVTLATKNALHRAKEMGMERVVFPTLGTRPFGKLSAEQSAMAILGAVYAFWNEESAIAPHQVIVAIHSDRSEYNSFLEILIQEAKKGKKAVKP